MNLRVDLILPTEQRSATVISAKGLLRIVMIVVPILVFLGLASIVWGYLSLRNQVRLLETQWEYTAPRQKAAKALRDNVTKNEQLANKLAGWAGARVNWAEHLRTLQRNITPDLQMQLSKLSIDQSMLLVDKNPARNYTLTIHATAFGENAERNVQTLQNRLLTDPSFTNYVAAVDITRFEQSPVPDHTKHDRLFHLVVRYAPRIFK